MITNTKIRIRLKAYDHKLLDQPASDIVDTANAVFIEEQYVYVATELGLAVIDYSDPIYPGEPIYRETSMNGEDIYISGNYVYFAAGNLHIYEKHLDCQ